jgi:hypothetical protein
VVTCACAAEAALASSFAAFTGDALSLAPASDAVPPAPACAAFSSAGFAGFAASVCCAGAAAAAEDGLSWSGNMVDGLREITSYADKIPCELPLRVCARRLTAYAVTEDKDAAIVRNAATPK